MKVQIIIGFFLSTLMWAVLFFGIVVISNAELKLRVIHIRGDNSLPFAQTQRVVGDVAKHFETITGLNIEISKIRKIRNPYAHMHSTYFNVEPLFYNWQLRIALMPGHYDVNLITIPPFRDNGGLWMAGLANTCRRGGVAMAVALEKNVLGKSRVAHSYNAILHEVGHVLGAEHDDDTYFGALKSVMHPNALYYVDSGVVWPQLATDQVRTCAGRWRAYAKTN